LASSVESSTDVYIARVLSCDDAAEAFDVQVIRVLKGKVKAGASVRRGKEDYLHKEDIGLELLFSNPKPVFAPTFPVLTPEFEDEVSFLIAWHRENEKAEPNSEPPETELSNDESKPKRRRERREVDPASLIKDLPEAIRRIQGISYSTSEAGSNYIKLHPEGALEALMKSADELMVVIRNSKDATWLVYREGRLIDAIATFPSEKTDSWFESRVEQFLQLKPVEADFLKSKWPDPEAELLADELNAVKDRKEVTSKLRTKLLEGAPKLSSLHLTEVVYALGNSGLITEENVRATTKDFQNKDAVALACYWIAQNAYSRFRDSAQAKLWLIPATLLSTNQDLNNRLNEMAKWLHVRD
jgi:hypothetical protein